MSTVTRRTRDDSEEARRSPRVSGTILSYESAPAAQDGIALITSLLIMVMVTLLALAMFHGLGMEQKVAGNTREKERAFEAGQNALQYAEDWLLGAAPGVGIACTGHVTIRSDADMRACLAPLPNPTEPTQWVLGSDYTPPAMMVAAGGGTATDGDNNADINYAHVPGLYIAYLGLSPSGLETLYSVTGAGFGGSATSTAVVRSVFATSYRVRPLDAP